MTSFDTFARMVADRHEPNLLDYGPEEQAATVRKTLEHFDRTTPLTPTINLDVDLAGFGNVPLRFSGATEGYFLASDLGEQLGWPLGRLHTCLDRQAGYAVRDQRRKDEDRGDGRLGYDLLRGYLDLGLFLTIDDPEAKPDAKGERWAIASDWLISTDRLPLLLGLSPWGKEYVDNVFDAWCHGMRKIHGGKLDNLTAVDQHGAPLPGVRLFDTDLTEDEALRKARRGPTVGDAARGESR